MSATKTLHDFIKDATAKHGEGRYDYSKVVYVNSKTNVTIICHEHGDFEQKPNSHLNGQGCKKCGYEKNGAKSRLSGEAFVTMATATHGGIYGYQSTIYQGMHTNTLITCHKHGAFLQTPHNHLKGAGCPDCWKERRGSDKKYDTCAFVAKAKARHPGLYDYSEVDYVDCKTNVRIVCHEHGGFMQNPVSHLMGSGCPKCSAIKVADSHRFDTETFIAMANAIHGGTYRYENVSYVGSKDKVTITCPRHGDFEQKPNSHLMGQGCPGCAVKPVSNEEKTLRAFLESIVKVDANNRNLLKPKEIDCLIASHKIGFEYCGLYYHSSKFIDKKYHLEKTVMANSMGYAIIHIFDDEWRDKRPIVESIIKNRLGISTRIAARKTVVMPVDGKESRDFLNKNHLQGHVNAEIRYGLYHGGELVMVATFSNKRSFLSKQSDKEYELVRLCPKLGLSVTGGLSKLIKHFIREHNPSIIKTYCDRRYFDAKGYEASGFTRSHDSAPNYFYVKGRKRFSRIQFQKHKLKDKLKDFDPTKTEHENMDANGYFRIYDCGNHVLIYTPEQTKNMT